jgi:hypothetical protein
LTNNRTQEQANRLLHEFGLLSKLNEYGKTHIIGSCKMNLMAWNDLDIDVENNTITISSIHELLKYIIDVFKPIWFEGKQEIMDGKKCFFIGFETEVLGELWNVDIWFLDKTEIEKCEKYCNEIIRRTKDDEILQNIIIEMKRELRSRGMYSSVYGSVDVYDAVLNRKIYSVDEMIKHYKKA